METKKKNKNIVVILLVILFIIFLSMYWSQINGYYEYNQHNKMIITKEAMEQFEKDVAEGKDISVNNYLSETYKSYSNGVSNVGLKTGEIIENFMTKGIERTFKILGALFID